MKIAWVQPHLHLVGGIRRVIEVSNRLVALGHSIQLFHPSGKPCRWLKNDAPTIKLEKLPKQKFDIVMFNLAEQYKHVLAANTRTRVFWVLAPEGLYKDPRVPLQALQHNFFFLANSKFTVEYVKQYRRVKYAIPIIPGGINPKHFKYNHAIKKEFHVLYYGSKRPWKGSELIRRALDNPNLKVNKMEGQGTHQTKMWKLYNSATCFVSACKAEGFSFPELEAMSCGCPVVCTDSGGNRDYITSANAITVKRNVQAIRQGVHMVLKHKDLRRSLRREGLKTARESRFDWNNVTKKLEDVLERILKNGRL